MSGLQSLLYVGSTAKFPLVEKKLVSLCNDKWCWEKFRESLNLGVKFASQIDILLLINQASGF